MIISRLTIPIVVLLATCCHSNTNEIEYLNGDFMIYNQAPHLISVTLDSTGHRTVSLFKEFENSLVLDGFQKVYYPNGQIAYHEEIHNGKRLGSLTGWTEDGVLQIYKHYDPNGTLDYQIQYDSQMNIINEEGILEPAILVDQRSNNYKFKIFTVEPPNLSVLEVAYSLDTLPFSPLSTLDSYTPVQITFGDSLPHRIRFRVHYQGDSTEFFKYAEQILPLEY